MSKLTIKGNCPMCGGRYTNNFYNTILNNRVIDTSKHVAVEVAAIIDGFICDCPTCFKDFMLEASFDIAKLKLR